MHSRQCSAILAGMDVRVRYAPSPTGLQHIGGIRTALFNYFFARVHGGKFILRIEDTDQERFDPNALQDIYDSFSWLGIQWDEGPDCGGDYGPYVQSQRVDMYRQYAQQLVESGHAYWAYDTPERLEKMRKEQAAAKKKHQGYDRFFRDMSEQERQSYKDQGIPGVVRLKVPVSGETTFDDLVMGSIRRKNEDVNPDPVLLKSDGYPTYHLANVVDDHHMAISHVLRAQEWIPSTPLHILLYQAFGWEPPKYAHLPMVLGKDGQKLSKRHGSTSLGEFVRQGYLPEAIINHIMLLGWSYDDKTEFFTREQLEEVFSADKISRSSAVFDYKKLDWFNGQYIRECDDQRLLDMIILRLQQAGLVADPLQAADLAVLTGALPLAKPRLKLLSDVPEALGFLFHVPQELSTEVLVPKKSDAATSVAALQFALTVLDDFSTLDEESFETTFHDYAQQNGVKVGAVMMPLRLAVTGSPKSPPLFGSISLLGAEEAARRTQQALQVFNL